MCVCVNACRYSHGGWIEVRGQPPVSIFTSILFETGSGVVFFFTMPSSMACRQPGILLFLSHLLLETLIADAWLYMDSRNSDSGPRALVASTLPTEPSPWSWSHFFFQLHVDFYSLF